MSSLNEKIFDYLKEQNKELSIGEINSDYSVALKAPVRETGNQ